MQVLALMANPAFPAPSSGKGLTASGRWADKHLRHAVGGGARARMEGVERGPFDGTAHLHVGASAVGDRRTAWRSNAVAVRQSV
jgi:hypothetical protein